MALVNNLHSKFQIENQTDERSLDWQMTFMDCCVSVLLRTFQIQVYCQQSNEFMNYAERRGVREAKRKKKKNSDQWPFKVETQNSNRLFINCFKLRGFLVFVILFVPLGRATSRQQPHRQYCCWGISVLKCVFFVCILFHGHLIKIQI